MKVIAGAILSLASAAIASQLAPDPLEYHPSIGVKVTKVGSLPVVTSAAYNMLATDDPKGGRTFFFDQMYGKIYIYENESLTKVWDLDDGEVPDGLDLNYQGVPQFIQKVKTVLPGKNSDEIYVVHTSLALPEGWTEPSTSLPAPGAFPAYFCGGENYVDDVYRLGYVPGCVAYFGGLPAPRIYDVFYKYTLVDGKLVNPHPFFAIENQQATGHTGGGGAVLNDGSILYTTGDGIAFGFEGMYAPQLDSESPSKILRIYPEDYGKYDILAKGVRNSQQFKLVSQSSSGSKSKRSSKKNRKSREHESDDDLVFMDIGGVTAEEVNVISLSDLLEKKEIQNFGWGRNIEDGKAREGTFYVGSGKGGVLSTEPPASGRAPVPEKGYIQPWIQFGRTPEDFFYGISGFCISEKSFDKLKLIWTEFNTGKILGTLEGYSSPKDYTGPAKGYKLKVYDDKGNFYDTGMNGLVAAEEGVEPGRIDPRMFHYADGSAGVLIEKYGTFYKLEEIAI